METDRTLSAVLMRKDSERNKAELIARHADEAFLRENPYLEELLQRRKNTGAELLNATVFDESRTEELKKQIAGISAEIKEKYGIWETMPDYTCPKCADTGYIRRSGKPCQCLIDGIYAGYYGARDINGLDGSFERFDENLFPVEEGQRERALLMKKRAEQLCETDKVRFLTLFGTSGTGKTFTLSSIARKMAAQGKTTVFIDSNTLFELFRMVRVNENEEKPFLAYLYNCDALFIDDLGSEPLTRNVTVEYFFDLIKRRNYPEYFTAFGTNLDFAMLTERYGERTTSRMLNTDCCKAWNYSGTDLRRVKKKKEY